MEIRFVNSVSVVKGNDINPVPIGEGNGVAFDINPDNSYSGWVSGNTQGHLRFKFTLGSLTALRFKIYFYTTEVSKTESFVQTVSSFAGSDETITPVVRKITASGNYDYYFTIPATNGLRVVFWGEGASNTGSKIELLHWAFRTN